VWPGLVGFPDFTANNTSTWWENQIATFHGQLPFDGS
jgi:alpha-glucosidase (family GH31 glycosyl hydrolase)